MAKDRETWAMPNQTCGCSRIHLFLADPDVASPVEALVEDYCGWQQVYARNRCVGVGPRTQRNMLITMTRARVMDSCALAMSPIGPDVRYLMHGVYSSLFTSALDLSGVITLRRPYVLVDLDAAPVVFR